MKNVIAKMNGNKGVAMNPPVKGCPQGRALFNFTIAKNGKFKADWNVNPYNSFADMCDGFSKHFAMISA